jgi:hypothetical protein
MNKTTMLVLLCLFAMGITHGQVVTKKKSPDELATYYLSQKGEVVFEFTAQNQNQFKELSRFLSISHKFVDPTLLKVEAYANATQFAKFKTYGLNFTVNASENEFVADEYTTFSTAAWDDTWNAYPTYSQYVAKMQYFAAQYPTLCTLENIGTTPNGRNLYVLKISDNASTDETEPEFLYTSSMHGDEITGFPTMMHLITELLTKYGTDSEITSIVNSTEIFICPLANPDGSYKTAGNNVMNSSGNTATRANANGVDLNRNYPDPIDGIHPDNIAYQPETLAFISFEKNRNFVLSANYHGGAEIVNFPWDTSNTPGTAQFSYHPHDNYFKFVSKEYAQLCQTADNNQNYMDDVENTGQFPGTTNGAAWYSVYGGRQDWNNFFNHNKEITVEISATKFPSASTLPTYWTKNRQALLNYVKQANYGLHGSVKDASGNPVNAKVYINSLDNMGSWIKTGPLGDYHKVQIAGTYSVIFEAPGYATQTLSATLTNNATTVLNVTMVPTTATPTANNQTICENQTATLTSTGYASSKWFASNTSTDVLSTGTSYTTPALTSTTSYFIENQTPEYVGLVAVSGTAETNANVANKYMVFNSTIPTRLKSVLVNASATGDMLVELQNNAGVMLESKVVRITTAGNQNIDLDFFVPAQNDLRLVLREIYNFSITAITSGNVFPMTNNVVTITGSGTSTFVPFFNWKFESFKSPRKEVIVTVKPNPTISSISPSTKIAGSTDFTLTVNGTNFTSTESKIKWNGVEKTTNFISATQLTAPITAAEVASVGTVNVTVYNTCNNYSTDPTTFTITAPTTTTWNGTAWNYGAPTATVNAIIAGNYATQTNGNFTAQSLTVNSGNTITINSGTNMTVSNSITNNAGATNFIVENNGNLIQSNEAVNTGLITVKRNSAPMYRYDYTLWSSPVSGQNLKSFSSATLSDRFYIYNSVLATNGNYETIFPAQDQATYNFVKAKGYLVRSPDNYANFVSTSTPGVSYPGVFIGVPHNGAYSFPLSNINNGYNLVGNPYPSAISIASLFSSNSNAIEGTVWLWRKRNGVSGSGYATTTGLGVASPQTGVNGMATDGLLLTGQGFFVKMKPNATQTSLNFNNAMRSVNTGGTFFRSATETFDLDEAEKHRIWINLSNETDVISQILVGYMTGATQGIDYGIEGKYFGDSPIALNSLVENTEFAVQGRSLPFSASDIIPLSFKTNIAGSYSISLDQIDGLFEGDQEIFLKDNMLGQVHNLKASSYSFTSESGSFSNRFELIYQAQLGINNPEMNASEVVVYKKNSNLIINSGSYTMKRIDIYDISGRLIFSKQNVNTSTFTVLNLNIANQVLVVKVNTAENGSANKKIVF